VTPLLLRRSTLPDRGHGRRRVAVGHEPLPLPGRPRHRGRRRRRRGRRRGHNVGRPHRTAVVRRGDRRRPRRGDDDDRGGAGRDGALADGAGRRRHGARRQHPPGQDPRPPRRVQVRSMTNAGRPSPFLFCTRNCRGVNGGIQCEITARVSIRSPPSEPSWLLTWPRLPLRSSLPFACISLKLDHGPCGVSA
jgi:hypothetical protein